MLHRTLAALCLLLCAAAGALAADRSVYGPSAPGDSAFVRVINLLPDPVKITLGGARIGPVATAAVSAYYAVRPDIFQVRAGGQEKEIVGKSGHWMTLACTAKEIIVLEDPPHTDPAKVQLFLYNLTSLPAIDLRSADGKTTVIAGVKAGASGVAVVNAVAVALAVWNGATALAPVDSLVLQRGASFSVFALPKGRGVTLVTVKAEVKTE